MGYVIGQPLLWPCPPNWAAPVRETLAFLSDVMVADTGAQQVRSLRDAPRRGFSFQMLESAGARRIMDSIRFDLGVRQLLLPIYPDVQLLTAPLGAGAGFIPCRTAGFDFVAGGVAVLWYDTNAWELVSVDTIEADGLTLVGATANAWPLGTRLYPVRKARLQAPPKGTYLNDELVAMQATFAIDEPCDWAAAWPTATQYRGQPVLEWRNEESEDPTDQYERLSDTVDQGVGPIYYFDVPGMPFRAQSQHFTLDGRDQHTAFRSLAYQLAGQAGQLWVPSWLADVYLTQSIASDATQLHVPWMGYTQFGYQQANRRDLAIELNDGTRLYRRITGSAEAADGEVLQLDAALGVDVDPGAIRQIGWLSMCSLASDTIQMDHTTDADGGALATLNWQAIKSDV